MKFKGIIKEALPITAGKNKEGREWRRAQYILEYDNTERREKRILFNVLNEDIEKFKFEVGKVCEVDVDFYLYEKNGKYISSTRCRRAVKLNEAYITRSERNAYRDALK